jgi:hypothetical protein
MPMGVSVVQVREDSLRWLLQKGAFLVAENRKVKGWMWTLSRFQLWGKVGKGCRSDRRFRRQVATAGPTEVLTWPSLLKLP